MSNQEDFRQPEKPPQKTREIDNEARISKKSGNEMKIQQKSEADNSVRHPAKLSNILAQTNQASKFSQIHENLKVFGIPEFLNPGRECWMLHSRRWSLDTGLWTLNAGQQTLNAGRWSMDVGRYNLDVELWVLDTVLDCFRTKSEASF